MSQGRNLSPGLGLQLGLGLGWGEWEVGNLQALDRCLGMVPSRVIACCCALFFPLVTPRSAHNCSTHNPSAWSVAAKRNLEEKENWVNFLLYLRLGRSASCCNTDAVDRYCLASLILSREGSVKSGLLGSLFYIETDSKLLVPCSDHS